MFFPTKDNLILHKQPYEINLNDAQTPFSTYWQGYGGRWGSSRVGKGGGPDRPNRCFNYEQNKIVKCPMQIPLVQSILDFLSSAAIPVIGCIIPELNAFLQRDLAPTGPPRKRYFNRWATPQSSPLWSCTFEFTDEEDFCNRLGTNIMKANQDDYKEGLGAFALSMWPATLLAAENGGRFLEYRDIHADRLPATTLAEPLLFRLRKSCGALAAKSLGMG